MREVVQVSPFRCRVWGGNERLDESLSEESCRAELASVQQHGQLLPALGRRIAHDSAHDFEIICGARRLFVARHLNVQLLLEIRDLTDREAAVALDIENRQRKDLSPYERGRSFSTWLRAGLFESQDELARVMKISPAQVSRLLKVAQLPAVLVNAFPSPVDICETWGRDLMELWADTARRVGLCRRARTIAASGNRDLTPELIYQHLTGGGRLRNVRSFEESHHDEIVKDGHGRPLFRVSVRRKGIAIMVPMNLVRETTLEKIKDGLKIVLQRESPQGTERVKERRVRDSRDLEVRYA